MSKTDHLQRAQMLSMLAAKGGSDLIKQEFARRYYHKFFLYAHPKPIDGWFIQNLCGVMQEFYEDMQAGSNPRLMITAPPRHGKTEVCSRYFPAWAYGKDPDLQIIGTSYGATLASRVNRDVQRIMLSERYASTFRKTTLAARHAARDGSTRNNEMFEVVGYHGSYRAAGVEGGITGMGGDIIIIDDPFKDFADSHSPVKRESVWEWYRSTLYTRQSPKCGIIIINTRWNTDDLSGRVLEAMEEDGDKWRQVNYPAIAEEDEQHRKAGEALFPERYTLPKLRQIEKTLGSYLFTSLFQQRPVPADGQVFKRDHWKFYKALPELDEVVISVDAAFKDLKTSDYVAIQVWGVAGANKYLIHRIRERMGFSATVKAVQAVYAAYPDCVAVLIEDKANGTAVVETLHNQIAGVIAINPEGGKLARAYAIQPEQEAGNLHLPDPSLMPGIEHYLHELSVFPSGKNDDEVDATTQAINWLRQRNAETGLLQYYKEEYEASQRAKGINKPADSGFRESAALQPQPELDTAENFKSVFGDM